MDEILIDLFKIDDSKCDLDERSLNIIRKRLGGMSLRAIAQETPPVLISLANVHRNHVNTERIRQIEFKSFRKIKKSAEMKKRLLYLSDCLWFIKEWTDYVN